MSSPCGLWNQNLLWLLAFVKWEWLLVHLEESLGCWLGISLGIGLGVGLGISLGGGLSITLGLGLVLIWVLWGEVAGGGDWRTWISLDFLWFFSGAWSTSWAILWSVSSRAYLSSAVDSVWAVVTVAWWELSGGLDLNWGP